MRALRTIPKSPRRWVRISLRSLLILTTLLAVWLAILSRRAYEQRIAVERVFAFGGSVAYDYQFDPTGKRIRSSSSPSGWLWLRRLIGDEYFQDVVHIGLNKKKVNDSDLRLIGRLKHLKSIQLNWTQVSDPGLAHLSGLRDLTSVGFAESRITGAGLRHLTNAQDLHMLVVEDTEVGDDGMAAIGELKDLRILNLSETRVTAAGIQHLVSLQKLVTLSLGDTPLDDSAVPHLATMKALRELQVTGTQLSGEGIATLSAALPMCQVSADMMDVSDQNYGAAWPQILERMVSLSRENCIKFADLSGTDLNDEHLGQLHDLVNVQLIDLPGLTLLSMPLNNFSARSPTVGSATITWKIPLRSRDCRPGRNRTSISYLRLVLDLEVESSRLHHLRTTNVASRVLAILAPGRTHAVGIPAPPSVGRCTTESSLPFRPQLQTTCRLNS